MLLSDLRSVQDLCAGVRHLRMKEQHDWSGGRPEFGCGFVYRPEGSPGRGASLRQS